MLKERLEAGLGSDGRTSGSSALSISAAAGVSSLSSSSSHTELKAKHEMKVNELEGELALAAEQVKREREERERLVQQLHDIQNKVIVKSPEPSKRGGGDGQGGGGGRLGRERERERGGSQQFVGSHDPSALRRLCFFALPSVLFAYTPKMSSVPHPGPKNPP